MTSPLIRDVAIALSEPGIENLCGWQRWEDDTLGCTADLMRTGPNTAEIIGMCALEARQNVLDLPPAIVQRTPGASGQTPV